MEEFMEFYGICSIVAILGLIGCALQFISVRGASRNVENRSVRPADLTARFCPPITILKPLKGLDDNLFDNLASFCTMDYPMFQIIFSLQDHNDPAYRIAKLIKNKYANIDITIHVERCEYGLNPKVNNLIPAYALSKYPFVLISDSNVMVEKDYLSEIISHMADPRVGLVSNMIRGTGGRSLGSILENLHLNSFIVGSVCMLDRMLGMPCVIGKSMLMRRTAFDGIGGFMTVKNVLAEDYIIGKRMHDAGIKVVLSTHLINNVNEFWSLKQFLNRHTRWGKIRWKIGGFRYVAELAGNPVFISFLPIIFWEASKLTVLSAALIMCIKILGDYLTARTIAGDMKLSRYLLVPVKDILIGCIWFVPLLSATVAWRGNRYLIGKDSVLSPCSNTGLSGAMHRLENIVAERLA